MIINRRVTWRLASWPCNPLTRSPVVQGLPTEHGDGLQVPFLGKRYYIAFPEFAFSDIDNPDIPIPLQEQVLILHYLQGCRPVLKNQWIAYREIPGAGFYFGPFVKRAVDPLKKVFGQNAAGLHICRRSPGGSATGNR